MAPAAAPDHLDAMDIVPNARSWPRRVPGRGTLLPLVMLVTTVYAQARLISLGISLRSIERLIRTDPDAALALAAESRDSSARALAELRALVSGINPPVLAERGLGPPSEDDNRRVLAVLAYLDR
jgi:Histidine kinase